jgi:hypothetical protein
MEARIQYAKTSDGVNITYLVLTSWIRRSDEWTIVNGESLMTRTQQVIAKANQEQGGAQEGP